MDRQTDVQTMAKTREAFCFRAEKFNTTRHNTLTANKCQNVHVVLAEHFSILLFKFLLKQYVRTGCEF